MAEVRLPVRFSPRVEAISCLNFSRERTLVSEMAHPMIRGAKDVI